MTIILRKVNDHVVKPVPNKNKDNRPPLHHEITNEVYPNICICAPKNSGKSTVVYDIVTSAVGPDTKVIIFAATLGQDHTYKELCKWLKRKAVPVDKNTSIFNDKGVNKLDELLKAFQLEYPESDDESDDDVIKIPDQPSSLALKLMEEEKRKKNVRKPKFQSPDYILVFDDFSHQMKNKAIVEFFKENRHYKSMCICSSQAIIDWKPEQRSQIDLWIIMNKLTKDALEVIHHDAGMSVPFDSFLEFYKTAINYRPYSFLTYDKNTKIFKTNFNLDMVLKP